MITEQVTFRISEFIKKNLENEANTRNSTLSGAIRSIIVEYFEKDDSNKFNKRLLKLEKNRSTNGWSEAQDKFIRSYAYIASIDTGLPIDETISKVYEVQKSVIPDLDTLTKLSRADREAVIMEIHKRTAYELNMSHLSYLILLAITITQFAYFYDTEILLPIGLPLELIEAIRSERVSKESPIESYKK